MRPSEDSRDEGAKKCPLQATGWHASPSLLPGRLLGPLWWIHFLFLQLEVPLEEDSCSDFGGHCENPSVGAVFTLFLAADSQSATNAPPAEAIRGDMSFSETSHASQSSSWQTPTAATLSLHNYSFKELSTKRWSMWLKGTRSQPRPRSTMGGGHRQIIALLFVQRKGQSEVARAMKPEMKLAGKELEEEARTKKKRGSCLPAFQALTQPGLLNPSQHGTILGGSKESLGRKPEEVKPLSMKPCPHAFCLSWDRLPTAYICLFLLKHLPSQTSNWC